MDYKERYEEALKRAKTIYTGKYKPDKAVVIREICEEIFTEFVENKGEKIRKTLIKIFNQSGKKDWYGIPTEKIIAWLKKQEKRNPQSMWNNTNEIQAPSRKSILGWYRKDDGKLYGSPKIVWFCSDEEADKEAQPNGFHLAYWAELPKEEFDKTYWFENNPQGKTALEAIKEEKVDNANKIEPKEINSIDPHFIKKLTFNLSSQQ